MFIPSGLKLHKSSIHDTETVSEEENEVSTIHVL